MDVNTYSGPTRVSRSFSVTRPDSSQTVPALPVNMPIDLTSILMTQSSFLLQLDLSITSCHE